MDNALGFELQSDPILSADEVIGLEKQYLLQNYARYPLVLDRGKGCYLYDKAGKRYLDLISGIGVNSLGYAHPRITKVIQKQAALLLHTSNLYYHEYQGRLAQKLSEASGLQRVFFCNSGAEAMEGALKMARSHGRKISPDKFELIALEDSFHGRTFGALSITGQPKYRNDFEPLLPGVKFVPRNSERALEAAFSDNTAAFIVEVIQGEGGIKPVCERMLKKARALCDKHNALLIFDEIQCGVGRTGTYFAYQLFDPIILPDITVLAKPISCGLPMGAILASDKAAAAIAPGMHGTTYGGGPLTTRVAVEFMDILAELLPSITSTGSYFRMRLTELARKFDFIQEIRGVGLMIGIQMSVPGKQMVLDGIEEGLLFNCTHDTVLRFLPPYILSEEEVDRAVEGLERVFTKHVNRQQNL
ncbi:aspartate aminotransferase family protein [Bryobacterales bacterium F-183]|nr:aspartate aminotransferase family protein [Bryobacterales bacterium F-183]